MIPDGDILRSRVVTDLAVALEDVLDRRLDGYAVLESRAALLGETDTAADARGVLTFEDGVPTLAYHAGTDRGGPPALADIGAGPHRFDLYALDAADLDVPHAADALRIPPGMPAERLAGDSALAERTRRIATNDHTTDGDALSAFLDNEAAVEDIRESARQEATRRAEEWGFDDAIDRD
ncbi:MAG: hypothetical protein ACI8UR_000419 [Natronomonas sp.]|jgi:hypothetical protein|uniref:hypothetical protein n=1 Tax=Natronomonas sp. TaxID=2184060 RepID=UPI0039899519